MAFMDLLAKLIHQLKGNYVDFYISLAIALKDLFSTGNQLIGFLFLK
jgi:hypothetical protein